MADLVSTALAFIETYGLIAIFILLVLDGAMLLPVFPGELVMIIAVTTLVNDPTDLVTLIVVASAAGLVGSFLLYGIVRGGGRRLVDKYPRLFMMPKKRRERLERSFRHPIGQSLVLFLRLVPLTRVLVNIPAGLAKMPLIRFTIMSTIGLVAYHAGFLWFAYEVRQPESEIGSQAAQLQEAYASPAWQFVETNAILAGLVVVGLGILWSIRESRRMAKEHDESTGSLFGTLTIAALIWGGLALAIALYVTPEALYSTIEAGGVDINEVSAAVGLGPVVFLAVISAVSVMVGVGLRSRRVVAMRRRGIPIPEDGIMPWEQPPRPTEPKVPQWALPAEPRARFATDERPGHLREDPVEFEEDSGFDVEVPEQEEQDDEDDLEFEEDEP